MKQHTTSVYSIVLAGLSVVAFAAQSAAQDRMVLGPRQFEFDTTGSGAVLCAWSIYLSIQSSSKACGLSRQPIDDALENAIAKIDAFILANSSLRPTPQMLEEFKRRAEDANLGGPRRIGLEKYCKGRDLETFRRITPEQLQESVKTLLATPREPTMNPCL